MKGGAPLKNTDRKTMYVWAGCLLVFLFVVFALFSVMGNKQDVKPDDFSGMKTDTFDLAQLPFANDAAEQALLDKYTDLNGNLPESTLYSSEEKKDRQASDAFAGIPAAPDAEYAAAQKDIPSASPASPDYGSGGGSGSSGMRGEPRRAEQTAIGTLQTGSMATGNARGGGGSQWNPSNLYGTNNRNTKIPASQKAAQQLASSSTGRTLMSVAGGLSDAAGKNAEAAQHGAAKTWAGGGDKAQMDGDAEKALNSLDPSHGGLQVGAGGGAGPSPNDLADAVKNNPPDKKDPEKQPENWIIAALKDMATSAAKGIVNGAVGWLDNKFFHTSGTSLSSQALDIMKNDPCKGITTDCTKVSYNSALDIVQGKSSSHSDCLAKCYDQYKNNLAAPGYKTCTDPC